MFTISERIGPSRTDSRGILKLGSALDLIQDCSLLWMDTEPVFAEYLRANGLGMFLVSRQADVVKLPVYGEQVSVTTGVYQCRSFYGYRNTVIYGQDGSPCVLTWSIGAFVDKASGRMVRLPQEVIDTITFDDKIDMEYLDKKITVPPSPGVRPGPIPVRRCDIDFYGHMNNARYVEDALEMLPEDRFVGRFRIEYKKPAKLGDLLFPRLIDAGDKCVVLLSDQYEIPYAVMEFTYG